MAKLSSKVHTRFSTEDLSYRKEEELYDRMDRVKQLYTDGDPMSIPLMQPTGKIKAEEYRQWLHVLEHIHFKNTPMLMLVIVFCLNMFLPSCMRSGFSGHEVELTDGSIEFNEKIQSPDSFSKGDGFVFEDFTSKMDRLKSDMLTSSDLNLADCSLTENWDCNCSSDNPNHCIATCGNRTMDCTQDGNSLTCKCEYASLSVSVQNQGCPALKDQLDSGACKW